MKDVRVILVLAVCGMAVTTRGALQDAPEKAPPPAADNAAPDTADSPEAKAVLSACAQAIRQARAITYEGHYRAAGGMLEGLLGSQRGSVKLLRVAIEGGSAADAPFVCLVDGTDVDRSKVESHIAVATTHGTIEWVDDAGHKVFERPPNDPQSRNKLVQASKNLKWDELLKPAPLNDLDQIKASLSTQESVDGVACDVVTLDRGHARKERWYIAVTDHLPRKVVTIPAGNNGELVLELSGVTVDNSETPSLTPEQVRVNVPSGYEEDRRSAPPPRPTPPPTPNTPSTPVIKKDGDNAPPVAVTPAPPPKPPEPVMAPDFELSVGRGAKGEAASGKVKLSDLRGSVLVLDFFGTWTVAAPAWHAELDTIISEESSQGVKFFALDVREKSPENAVAYMEQEKHAPALLMNADAVAKDFGVHVYPATAVIDRDGKIVELIQGSRAGGESQELVKSAIAKARGTANATDSANPDAAPKNSEPKAPNEKPADAAPDEPKSPKSEPPSDPK